MYKGTMYKVQGKGIMYKGTMYKVQGKGTMYKGTMYKVQGKGRFVDLWGRCDHRNGRQRDGCPARQQDR